MNFLDIIRSGDYVVLDTETTGLDRNAEICQIAIIDSSGAALLDTLVKPVRMIPPDAIRVHGISNDMVKDAPAWADITPQVQQLLKGQNIIVYNAVYDRKLMHQSAEQAGLPKVNWIALARWMCAMQQFSPIYGEWNAYTHDYRWQKLTTAAAYYNVTIKNAHSALGDCLMTLAVCKAMAGVQ